MKTSEIEPGDKVLFHHHRHGKVAGTYVGKMGKRHHHVVLTKGGKDEHTLVHGDSIASAQKARHHVRNQRLQRHLGRAARSSARLGDDGNEHGEHDMGPATARASLHQALGMGADHPGWEAQERGVKPETVARRRRKR